MENTRANGNEWIEVAGMLVEKYNNLVLARMENICADWGFIVDYLWNSCHKTITIIKIKYNNAKIR